MSIPSRPQPAKLVIGACLADKRLYPEVATELTSLFGPADIVSAWLDFDYTTYYQREMGSPLYRRIIAFEPLIGQEDLASIKVTTNRVEQRFAEQGRRQVNIDPGYLLLERFVLASGKNFTHRIYLQQGIYADLTLIYTRGGFQTLAWTYPDYAARKMLDYLTAVRNKYKMDLKKSVKP
jgi:hypothetical protein